MLALELDVIVTPLSYGSFRVESQPYMSPCPVPRYSDTVPPVTAAPFKLCFNLDNK